MDTTSLTFINHASVLVRHKNVSVLSDPWYQGDAFHKGWNLIHELRDEEISDLLDDVTHIWISHEHPDHFSILFFKKFGNKIKERKIQILFQYCKDQRVQSFLAKSGFDIQILSFNEWVNLSDEFEVLCFKQGFYDSGLAIRTSDKTIINVNDCQFEDDLACKELLAITGECDILVTQFSYASWKGGIENVDWRKLAAREKIDTMKLQASYLKPKMIIPFASFIYFSNKANFYLNDAHNTPSDVIQGFVDTDVKVNVMMPFEVIDDLEGDVDNVKSIEFWSNADQLLANKQLNEYEEVSTERLKDTFVKYKADMNILIKAFKKFCESNDGDYKLIKIKNYRYTILPYKNNQKWTIKGNLNNKLEGTIDFNVKGKPNPPAVNLLLKFQKINNTNKIIILFFDPTGQISPINQPLNIWYNIKH